MKDDLALLADGGAGLRVIDISDPTSPVEVGFYDTPGFAADVAVKADLALVVDVAAGLLLVIDISDPANPVEVGVFDTPGFAQGLAVKEELALVADGEAGLVILCVAPQIPIPGDTDGNCLVDPVEVDLVGQWPFGRAIAVASAEIGGTPYALLGSGGALLVLDITDPADPILVSSIATPGVVQGLAVTGNLTLVADGYKGLRVIDISDPTSPSEVGFFDTPYRANSVAAKDDLALVTDLFTGLRVIDLSDPTNPVELGFYDTPSISYGVVVKDDLALVAAEAEGLRVIDISDPTSPFEIGFYDTPGFALSVAVKDDLALVADLFGGLRVIDISDPTSPSEVGFFDTPDVARDVAVKDDLALVADHSGGLRVIAIADPISPAELGSLDTPGEARGVAVKDDLALVADHDAGLRVIDVSDPTSPSEVGFYDTPDLAWGVAVKDELALVADGTAGLRIVDISDPTSPVEVGFFDTPDVARDVAVKDDLALVADSSGGLRVIDISDPTSPSEIGFYDTPGSAYGVAVKDNLALVADGSAGLRVIDISVPASPSEISFYDTPGFAEDVDVKDDLALVADSLSGLRIIDISDPTSSSEIGFYDTPGAAYGVAVKDDLALMADFSAGLVILCVAPQIPIPGDADGNCLVNVIDLKVAASALGTSDPEADLNDDGFVNVLDLAIAAVNLQRATGAIAPVPDPMPSPPPDGDPVVDRLKVATPIQLETSDPVNAVGENVQNLPMYEALVRYNELGLLEPMLAESWSVTPDARNWTFNLRQGVLFHKGFGEFTAADVIHTNERHGRDGVGDGTHQGFFRDQVIGHQSAPDDYTVVFNLPNARIDMDEVMSSKWHNLILSKAHFDGEGQDGVENNPIGTNTYQYVERSSGEYVLFERVPFEHHRVTSDFPEVQIFFVTDAATRLAILLAGEAHMTTLPPDLEATAVDAGMRLIAANDPTLTLMACLCGQFKETVPWGSRLGENPDLPYSDLFHPVTEVPWVDRRVREALNRAINREEINATLLAGLGQPMYVPNYHPTLRGWNPEWETNFEADYGYDPDRARELLEEVEAEIGQELDWSQVVLASTNKPELPVQVAVSEAIHGYLLEIGADFAIDSKEYVTWRPHLFNNTIGGVLWPNVSSKFGDPDILRILFYSPFVCCHFYESDEIDGLYDQLVPETDLGERQRLLQEAGQILYDEYATIPLFWLATTYIVNPEVVEDYQTGGVLGLRDLEHVVAVRQ